MKKKLVKIFFHTSADLESYNAQNVNGREIASRLDPKKYRIYIISHTKNFDKKLLKKNIKIFFNPFKNKFLKRIYDLYLKISTKCDIHFYIRVYFEDSIFLFLKNLFLRKRFCVHMIENTLPYPDASKQYHRTSKFNAKASNVMIPISRNVSRSAEDTYNIELKNVPIISIGVDTQLFFGSDSKKNNTRLKIISCGTLQKRKRPEYFVEAAEKFPNCDFTWFGEGGLLNDLNSSIVSKSLANVCFKKNINHNALSKEMSKSDIFLFPSYHEGFPKVIVEAMASGLPVIAFKDYLPEAIEHNKNGYIVSNKEEMLNSLEMLINNETLRNQFSISAKERAKEYDWNKIVDKWDSFLTKAISKTY
tara:strand:- start:17831 stop:18916 length:1086 start_codon:yes stop_codon:yes gene_type:complete